MKNQANKSKEIKGRNDQKIEKKHSVLKTQSLAVKTNICAGVTGGGTGGPND